jgi:uncharacterized protein YutE (UPF0331/DUF86 family)
MSNARKQKTVIRSRMVKLRNRRVRADLLGDGTLFFTFRKLEADRTIVHQNIRLSVEAVAAMAEMTAKLFGCREAVKGEG